MKLITTSRTSKAGVYLHTSGPYIYYRLSLLVRDSLNNTHRLNANHKTEAAALRHRLLFTTSMSHHSDSITTLRAWFSKTRAALK